MNVTLVSLLGTGSSGANGDGVAATSGELNASDNVFGDTTGVVYIGCKI